MSNEHQVAIGGTGLHRPGPYPARPATAQDTDHDTRAANSGVVVAVLPGEEH
jgi:hypothetical protein